MSEPYYADDAGCACSCGGQPAPGRQFITGHNLRVLERTEEHRRSLSEAAVRVWETKRQRMPLGTRRLDSNGYWLVKVREGGGRWDKEHVLVMESVIGRRLHAGEEVHHLNGVKTDNRAENLLLCPNKSFHSQVHGTFAALLPELTASGAVVFDRDLGRYRCG
jgi:hypothetical protein